jgi:outer membrane immunogenic protein
MAGGGIEWAFAPNWTARIDPQYIGLENTTVAPGFLVDAFTTRNANVQTLTVGVNYLFNWGAPFPVVSRY